MRSGSYLSFGGLVALQALSAAARSDHSFDDANSERSAPSPKPKPKRTATEADNTRLRQAAERRYRKAQRQALGMWPPPAIGASPRSLQPHRLADPINTEGK